MEKKLLHTPEGVRDIYNTECENKLHLQAEIHNTLKMYGYNDIQTPTFEFFDIFGKEKGSVKSKNMYKFFDREGDTLVLRPDMKILLYGEYIHKERRASRKIKRSHTNWCGINW